MSRKRVARWAKDIAPCIIVLLSAIVVSLLLGPSRAQEGQVIGKALLRFFRVAFVLSIPLYVLFPIYSRILEWRGKSLLRVEQDRELTIRPLRHWLFRPFQGIGIGFLFRSKLLAMLQLIAGPSISTSLVIPRGSFEAGQFLLISAITALVSVLLSVLWTLDDMGIRYFNKRDQELKMIGKYVGTVMPVIFGLYGVLGFMTNYPTTEALLHIFRAVVVLYPPFALFVVVHTYFIRRRRAFVEKRDTIRAGGIWPGVGGLPGRG
jgi:hypothetical protein